MSSTLTDLELPRRGRGRPSAKQQQEYDAELQAWCDALQEFASTVDFKMSSRGWCYYLESHGLAKEDFDVAERLINECRKSGALPVDICAEDTSRAFDGDQDLDRPDVRAEAQAWLKAVRSAHRRYTPISFWDDQPYYLQLLVEKIDLKSLWTEICHRYHIPHGNAKGWADINSRVSMMRRFQAAEERGQIGVLLYGGDFDPAGLNISETLLKNLDDLAGAVGWSPRDLIVDRFALNIEFIEAHNLTWISGLATGNPRTPNLEDPDHPDHFKPYVQDYIAQHGARKVEANALVVVPDAARQLLLATIHHYVDPEALTEYEARLRSPRRRFQREIRRQLREEFGS